MQIVLSELKGSLIGRSQLLQMTVEGKTREEYLELMFRWAGSALDALRGGMLVLQKAYGHLGFQVLGETTSMLSLCLGKFLSNSICDFPVLSASLFILITIFRWVLNL